MSEDSLRDELERLRTLFEAMPDPAYLKDGEGRWLEVNRAGLELFDLSGVDYRGKTEKDLGQFTEFYREALLYCLATDADAWLQSGISRAEETIPRRDGTPRVLDTYKLPLFHPDGSRKALVVLGRDVTERIAMERLKTQFLGVAAHEMRTPLTPLRLLLDQLGEAANEGRPVAAATVQRMSRLTDRLVRLVDELLDVVRLERDALPILLAPLDLGALVETVAAETRLRAPDRCVEVTRPKDASLVLADESRIEQVLGNLVDNALKYGAGTIEVRVVSEPNGARVEVADHGPGIATEQMQGLFSRFYRVRSDATIRSPGLGLGLYIAREIIQRHGGEIGLSTEPGHGSTFYFRLPRGELP